MWYERHNLKHAKAISDSLSVDLNHAGKIHDSLYQMPQKSNDDEVDTKPASVAISKCSVMSWLCYSKFSNLADIFVNEVNSTGSVYLKKCLLKKSPKFLI